MKPAACIVFAIIVCGVLIGCGGGGGSTSGPTPTPAARLSANVGGTAIATDNAYFTTKAFPTGSFIGITGVDEDAGWAISVTVAASTTPPVTHPIPSGAVTCKLMRISGGAVVETYTASSGTITIETCNAGSCTGTLSFTASAGELKRTVSGVRFRLDYLAPDDIDTPPAAPVYDDNAPDAPPPPPPYFDPGSSEIPPPVPDFPDGPDNPPPPPY